MVGVLVFVDENVPESSLVESRNRGEGPEQVDRLADQVIEIEGIRRLEAAGVFAEDVEEDPLLGVVEIGAAGVGLDIAQLVLELRDLARRSADGEAERVGVEVADDPLDERSRISGVVDGEVLAEPEVLGLTPQDSDARRVERRDPHALGRLSEERLHSLAHFGRGLVREGDCEDLGRPRLAGVDQAGDATGKYARLARAGAGDDQQRGSAIFDRFALSEIEAGQKRGFLRFGPVSGIDDERH